MDEEQLKEKETVIMEIGKKYVVKIQQIFYFYF